MDVTRKNTSVFVDGVFSRKERKDRKAGGPTSVSATIDRSGWKRVRLGDVLQVCHGKCQHAIESKTGKYPILATSGEIGRTDSYLYDKPSVLIGRKGTIDKPQYIDTPFWTIDTLFYTKIAEGYNPKFLFYLCITIDWASMNEASGVPSLSANRIESLDVAIPDIDEQDKIANAMSSIDKHISTLDAFITKYEEIKKATVNLLLTPKSGWERVKLGDVAVTSSGGTPNRSNEGYYQGTIPWFTTSELHDEVLYDSKEHISEEALQKTTAKVFPAGTLLLAMYGATIGKLGVLAKPAATNQACCAIKCGSNVETAFLFQVLINRRQELVALGCGAGQPNISQQIVQNLSLVLPPLSEQRKIAEKIIAIDNALVDYKAQLEKARQLKAGMMSYFFG